MAGSVCGQFVVAAVGETDDYIIGLKQDCGGETYCRAYGAGALAAAVVGYTHVVGGARCEAGQQQRGVIGGDRDG